jgi:type IV pilus assembly protein PilF
MTSTLIGAPALWTRTWLLFAVMATLAMAGLTGCATRNGDGAQDASRGDLVTESDEPDTRRRARIRLELAVGYFEQGQTTVALDELKQSLAADPTFADAYNLRGLIYMRLNDPRLAEEGFRRATSLNPRNADPLHNLGWLMCQQARYADATRYFAEALANPSYGGRAKTFLSQGLCQMRAGQRVEAEKSLLHSYELDAANPFTGYNLALVLFQRGEYIRAQFYVRRINNSELANAETLWLGIRTERRLNNDEAVQQLAAQLKKRFGQSRELAAYERGAFDE